MRFGYRIHEPAPHVRRRQASIRWIATGTLLVLLTAACSDSAEDRWSATAPPTEQMSSEDASAIDAAANAALEASPDLPGMWIGVWDPAKGVHIAAYGEAVEGGAAATADDHNRIGSVTKTFTAVAVLQQVEAGKLSLDDTIEGVLPDLAADYPDLGPITVEQLLGMRSGIPDYANTGAVLGPVIEDPSKVWTVDEVIATTLDALPLESPGTGGYSTTNYLILGEMVESVTGEPIEETITSIGQDVGMQESALQAPEEIAMPDPASHGYLNAPGVASLAEAGVTAEPGQDVSDWTVSYGQAGGGMYSTVADLAAWGASGLGNTLLSTELGDQRLETQPIPEGNYGLGIYDWGNGWMGHTGQVIGWESLVAYNRDSGAVLVVMVNETDSIGSALSAVGAVFPDLMQGLSS